jgi:hypothetical protein
VTSSTAKTAAELFDDFIKLEWQDIFRREVHVRLDNGARYVPNSGSQGVQLLRKDVNAFDEAIRIWSGSTEDPDSGTKGYDRIVDQVGVKYTWEWFLIDPARRGPAQCRRSCVSASRPTSTDAARTPSLTPRHARRRPSAWPSERTTRRSP